MNFCVFMFKCTFFTSCALLSHHVHNALLVCTFSPHSLNPATALRNLFLELLNAEDESCIPRNLQAVATRSPSAEHAMDALLFHNGFHALMCYRLGHRLSKANRIGLAYYSQSTVSWTYSADIHPAGVMGHSIYLRVEAGVVIGKTAVVGNEASILEGVTLGGTGKDEAGDRHPKVRDEIGSDTPSDADFGVASGIGLNGQVYEMIYTTSGRDFGGDPIGLFKGFCTVVSDAKGELLCTYEIYIYANGDNGLGGVIVTGREKFESIVTGAEFDFSEFSTGFLTTVHDPQKLILFSFLSLYT